MGFTRIGLDDLADGFIDYCESVQQLALRTVERYRAALAHLKEFSQIHLSHSKADQVT